MQGFELTLKPVTFSVNVLYIFLIHCSVLEGEMYQLSHMLTEQKSLMTSMMEMSLVSDKG